MAADVDRTVSPVRSQGEDLLAIGRRVARVRIHHDRRRREVKGRVGIDRIAVRLDDVDRGCRLGPSSGRAGERRAACARKGRVGCRSRAQRMDHLGCPVVRHPRCPAGHLDRAGHCRSPVGGEGHDRDRRPARGRDRHVELVGVNPGDQRHATRRSADRNRLDRRAGRGREKDEPAASGDGDPRLLPDADPRQLAGADRRVELRPQDAGRCNPQDGLALAAELRSQAGPRDVQDRPEERRLSGRVRDACDRGHDDARGSRIGHLSVARDGLATELLGREPVDGDDPVLVEAHDDGGSIVRHVNRPDRPVEVSEVDRRNVRGRASQTGVIEERRVDRQDCA